MSNPETLVLVFSSSSTYYLSRFFKPGFQHVHAFARMGKDWFLIDPGICRFRCVPILCEEDIDMHTAATAHDPSCRAITLEVSDPKDLQVYRFGPISCVSTIQYLIGVYWPLTLTPYQLYCRLLSSPPSHIRIIDDGI